MNTSKTRMPGVIHRNVFALFEGDAVELGRRVEDAVLQHVVQLEVRLDLLFIQIVLRLADLLGVEVPIPRLHFEAAILQVDYGLDVAALPPPRAWLRERPAHP